MDSIPLGHMDVVFWNVDTQYDFMRDDQNFKGALAIPGARSIEENLLSLTRYAAEDDIPRRVVNTADWHTTDSEEISDNPDFVHTFPPHCLMGTKGAEYVPATAPHKPYIIDWRQESFDEELVSRTHGDWYRRNIVLYKDKFDVFAGNKHTEKVLELLNPDIVVVYGVATNVCVDYAVRGLLDKQKRGAPHSLYVVQDAIKEIPNLPLEETLARWRDGGAKLVITEKMIDLLNYRR